MIINVSFSTGRTLVATLYRLSDGNEWRQAATAAWQSAGTSTFANRKITLTEGTSEKKGSYSSAALAGLGDALRVRVLIHDDADADDITIASFERWVIGSEDYDVSDVIAISGDTTAANNCELAFNGTGFGFTGCTMPTTTTVTNMVTANTIQISGDATAADNAELAFDGTGYGFTNCTMPTVTTVTTTTTVTDPVTVGTINANVITASALATDAVTEIVAGVWNAAQSSYIASGSFGANLQVVRAGTATAGAATTITLDAGASATDDFYNGMQLRLVGGAGVGEVNDITDYVGATKVATVGTAWTTNPASGSQYIIEPGHPVVIDADAVDAIWDIVIEAGAGTGNGTARALLAFAGAGAVAQLTGMGTTTGTLKAVDDAATTRATATIDQDGNRTAITVTAPT